MRNKDMTSVSPRRCLHFLLLVNRVRALMFKKGSCRYASQTPPCNDTALLQNRPNRITVSRTNVDNYPMTLSPQFLSLVLCSP